MMNTLQLHSGELVEVRSKEEILGSLDGKGQLEGLPFMPQMIQFCGQKFRVFKRAHKTCDTVNDYTGRRMNNAVHLEGIRCDGQAYGGCEAGCLIFWKETWLKRANDPGLPSAVSPGQESRDSSAPASPGSMDDVWAGTKASGSESADEPAYVCQATQVPAATQPLAWWDLRQYAEDLTSGNVGLGRMARGFFYMGYWRLARSRTGLGHVLRRFYDDFQRLRGGVPYPRRMGKIPVGAKTPHMGLDLQPGELVRVKSYPDILATLDTNNRNRGLYFDAEMVPYCGRTFRVLKRVKRILNEKTGRMTEFKNPCIILEGVVCESRYSQCRLFCPRSIYSYWREIWLERVSEAQVGAASKELQKAAK